MIEISFDSEDLNKYLDKAPENTRRAVERIIARAPVLTQRFAKLYSPVDTGRLRSSIYTDARAYYSVVSTNVDYAVFVHEGTRHMSATPFMTDALGTAESEIDAMIDAEIGNAIK